jgi:hypothetical protein
LGMKFTFADFKESFRFSKRLFEAQPLALIGVLVASCTANLYLENMQQAMDSWAQDRVLILQVIGAMWSLCEAAFIFLILSYAIPKVKPLREPLYVNDPFTEPVWNSFGAECLRMVASILLWTLCFIIPGIVRYCQLTFVPYIALYSRDYRNGNVDALKLSTQLARKCFWWIVIAIVGTFALQAFFEYLPKLVPELQSLVFRALCSVCGSLVGVWAYALNYMFFEKALEDK